MIVVIVVFKKFYQNFQ